MKLWHVAQWGNHEDGGNGADTNCIVRAPDLKTAINIAEDHFDGVMDEWNNGVADVAYLLGDDCSPLEEAKVVVRLWIDHAFNLGHYDSWHRDYDTGEWVDAEAMYGDYINQ
jgi:hypothetical protein